MCDAVCVCVCAASVGVVSTVVPDSAHKLFIGGLPNYLNDDQVDTSAYILPPTEQRRSLVLEATIR